MAAAYTKEQWKVLLSVPKSALTVQVLNSINAHEDLIKLWVGGGALEKKMSSQGNWEPIADSAVFYSGVEYRAKESVKFSVELSYEEAIAFYDDLYENNHRTMNSITARNKIMKGIDKELCDKWGK
ncbi:hypothetical protein PQC38_gp030 [Aeromonas phage BUCT695]|uniref:hypothetical protein n=1 Tax=Aeromonas phage BUCT695 TaxID=2908630 RepID=UPI00232907D2|nr:hypothetical protein PQC38_gp030 [Aeromonas phage BUCT695]UIW10506.1 hypothetical protein [Aeromonas phage BUCT695]